MKPGQVEMQRRAGDGAEDPGGAEEEPVLLSGAAHASRVATALYVLVAIGHIWVLQVHTTLPSAGGGFFMSLACVEVALAYEAAVFAFGAWGRSLGFRLLSFVGRVRLLGAAIAWPWLVPWVTELGCRCGAVAPATGAHLLHFTGAVATMVSMFFIVVEVSFLVRGEPPSAFGGKSQVADCLPNQAVLGGQFRLDKADLEQTGRAVFVPARPRHGLYVGAGLAMLAHLIAGVSFAKTTALPPWLLLGALCALFGRQCGALPKLKVAKGDDDGPAVGKALQWKREGPRLLCRIGELFWIWCLVAELQRCEASPSWLAACQ